MNIPNIIICPECHQQIQIDDYQISDYFSDKTVQCSGNHEGINWWKLVSRAVEKNFMRNQAFVFIGAKTNLFNIKIKQQEKLTYKFSDDGIPSDAKVLYVNYTTQNGNLFPIETHGNISNRRLSYKDEVTVFPAPLHADDLGEESDVSVMVSWVPKTLNDESLLSLTDAFESYTHHDYAAMIVPANVAVESAMTRLLNSHLQKYIGKKRIEEFFKDGASYGNQLNVLIPLIAAQNKLPILSDQIRGTLNKLRNYRNDLAHTGALKTQLAHKEAAELLCGSLFGFHYVRHIGELLKTNAAKKP